MYAFFPYVERILEKYFKCTFSACSLPFDLLVFIIPVGVQGAVSSLPFMVMASRRNLLPSGRRRWAGISRSSRWTCHFTGRRNGKRRNSFLIPVIFRRCWRPSPKGCPGDSKVGG